ncbi:unnamed protein product [Fraxinus pennsylvanica]|uniref:Uncharacterized protein n=1 Tax=Fraxinus pennsylvanica TaxID=56036 RepID=A0AAD2DRK6_9LAMI|nr:unnamed protein product [Fraxinus pennsylvanica]
MPIPKNLEQSLLSADSAPPKTPHTSPKSLHTTTRRMMPPREGSCRRSEKAIVLVPAGEAFRWATRSVVVAEREFSSGERRTSGRILKRAFSKLKLEHVVIEKGQFKQERTKVDRSDVMTEEELLALLRDEEDGNDKWIQTSISDENLEKILDRNDLIVNSSDDKNHETKPTPIPLKGPGWEVVILTATGGMLSTLNS